MIGQGHRALRGEAMALVPLLMLPMVAGALLLLALPGAALAQHGRLLVVLGAVALAWYGLGGALALARLAQGWRCRRALVAAEARLASEDGAVWITGDPDGPVLWQSAGAVPLSGDLGGAPLALALRRLSATPEALIAGLAARAARPGGASCPIGQDGQRLSLERDGPLLLWRLHGAPEAAEPARPSCDAALIDRLPVALLRFDASGRVAAANPAAEALLAPLEPGASIGQLFDGLGRPVEEWADDLRHARLEPRPEVLRCRRPGRELFVQVALRVEADGTLLAVLSDASAIKTLEAQFVQSQKMQAIGQLAGGIAHDFNNLLTAISGHVDLLMLRHDKADPDYADLDQIGQNANRAASLVGQLLAFSRKQTLNPRLIDLRETLADLTHLLNRLVGERIRLRFEHDPGLCPIRVDLRQLEQVVMNLVVNARDAMASGGRITVRTSNVSIGRTQPHVRLTLPKGRYVCVTVTDEGHGIPADRIDKIFEPFFTTKRTGDGTGLGLATVYGIVKQSGGYVVCDSTPGEGTTFSLYFPAHDHADLEKAAAADRAAERARQAARAVAAVPARAGVVLLVEDEAPVRAFASRALKLKGFEVLEADSAEAALKLLVETQREIDVFVTDVVMPGMDGPSWVRSALRDRPGTRVVFISGYTEDIFADGRAPVPNAVFLQKPFSLAGLTDTVMAQLRAGAAPNPVRIPA